MITRLSNIMFWFVLVMAFAVAGCGDKADPLATGPVGEKIGVMSDYASGAIKATGGYWSWKNVKKLEADSVVTFYKPDGSFYLTKHCYEIYPWSNSIRISATEPQSSFVWELSKRGLKGGRCRYIGNAFPTELCGKQYFTELMLDITTAPVRLLDRSVGFIKQPQPVKLEGLWYYPIKRTVPADRLGGLEQYWSKAVFYQRTETSLIDMIWFSDIEKGKFLVARGYDYSEIEKGGVLVPTKIEVFRTGAQGVLKERLVKIDIISIAIN